MNLNQLQSKLNAAARAHAPGEHVPYAFEKRIMARLTATPLPDNITLWAQALWRAALPCLAVVLLITASSFLIPQDTTTEPSLSAATEFNQDFENTLLAAVEQTETTEEGL